MISCLMVTQAARLALAELAISDFAAQTHADRELLVLHDGDAAHDAALRVTAARHTGVAIRVLRERPGQSLGALRNAAVAAARGEFVCQWDDDDRYHPERLALQWEALRASAAEFCFLRDQLHWFPARGELYWDDWDAEPYPLNFVQGTLLGRRARMPRYPEVALGEDTGVVLRILRRGDPIARLQGVGWCHVYVYHGANVWSSMHHTAISQVKRYDRIRLLRNEVELRRRLAEYRPGLGRVRMPHAGGALYLDESGTAA